MIRFPDYIDTHSHLNFSDFDEAWQTLIPRALDEGTWMILVGHDYASSMRAIEIAREFSYGVYAAIGIHPTNIARSEISPQNFGMDAFQELASHPKVVAIGEVGFDTRDAIHELDETQLIHKQEEVLRQFAALARDIRLPMILHAHGAHHELLRFLSWFATENRGMQTSGVVHHFTDTWLTARAYLAHDVIPTLTGLIARSHTCHDLIRRVPQEYLLLESECPNLVVQSAATPRPSPAYLPGAVGHIATLRGETLESTRQVLVKNALQRFPKIVRNLP